MKNKPSLITCFSKGLEKDTGLRMSEVINEELPGATIVAMSGPCHAKSFQGHTYRICCSFCKQESGRNGTGPLHDAGVQGIYQSDIIGVELWGC